MLLAPSLPDGSAELLSLKNVLLISQHHLTKTAAALLNQRRASPGDAQRDGAGVPRWDAALA